MSVTGTNISLTLRQVKGSELTHQELDDNQTGLKTAVESHSHDEFAPALGVDDNYVTDAEKTAISTLSSTYEPKNANIQQHISSTSDPHNTQFDQLGGTLTRLPLNVSLAAQTLSQGEMAWNPDERTADLSLNGVTLQVGQEILVNVRNSTASTIPNGTVCMATGTIGASGRITVAPMDGTDAANAMRLIGIATEDITAGEDGFVTAFGKVRGVNTAAYVDGDILHTSTSTPGALTKTAPTSGLKQPIAIVINAASNGTLFVRVETLNHLQFATPSDLTGLLNETSHDLLDHTGLVGIPAAYTLPTASTDTLGGVKVDGTTVTITDGVISSTATGGVTDHGALTGLADDDHMQYLNETRHDLLDHTGLTGIPTQYTDEMVQDAVGALITAGTQTGISVTYDDAEAKLNFTVTASGAGDVTGPASSTNNNFAAFDGVTGKLIKDSGLNSSSFAPALDADDNYVTDAEKTKLANLSGTNTGDQDLSGYATTTVVAGKENFHGVESVGAISFNDSTHIISLASVKYWYKGTAFESLTPVTCDLDSFVTLTADTLYFVYFEDITGTLKASSSAWNLKEKVPVAIITWNGSVGAVGYECHNHTRDLDWHVNAHTTIGTRYQSGLVQALPSTGTDNQLSIGSGTIWDEDIQTNIGAQTSARLWYKTATAYTFESTPTTLPYKWNSGTSRVQYLDTDTNALTDLATKQYTVVWVYATTDLTYPIYLLVGEHATPYTTAAAARAATPPSLAGSDFNPESKLIYRWIYQGNGEFIEAADYRQASTLPAGGTAATSATAVTFTPSGNLSATNVQAAIEELDSEKAAITQLHDAVTVSDSTSIDLTLTGQQISAAAIFGTTAGTIAQGNHLHTGVYEPADATILKTASIGVSVQAYDADLTSWAAIAPSAKQDTLVSGTNIKTINSTSLLGSGDVAVQPTLVSGTNIKTVNGASVLGSGNLTVSGGVSTDNGSLQVGTFCIASPYGFSDVANGATVSGSSIHVISISISNGTISNTSTPTGTFRNVSGVTVTTSAWGLFQRIA